MHICDFLKILLYFEKYSLCGVFTMSEIEKLKSEIEKLKERIKKLEDHMKEHEHSLHSH
jgi:predicted  nucleic acid-binding Zn-ribbon protein